MKGYRWQLLPKAPEGFLSGSRLPHLLIQLLYNRGIASENEIESFVTADARLSHDPFKLPDIEAAIIRILRALLLGEAIAIYGDYDVDGITSTAILVKGLASLSGKVIPYIPHRILEGYGLNVPAIEELKSQGVSLIITVDNGITAVNEVKEAKKLGIDVIITDHHTPLSEIPEAVAVINPKRSDSKYPFSELSGAGVAYKLVEALYRNTGKEKPPLELTDLVALGTIADITPLVGENRYLVKKGLAQLNAQLCPGIREMRLLAGLGNSPLDAENIAWVIAPRLNAAGRLAHAMDAYKLIVTESQDEARELALLLEQKNAERQEITARVIAEARDKILANGITELLFASDQGYPAGITGLAASKLAEEFYRPVVLVSAGEVVSIGSCRSIPEFNIITALNECRQLLSRFGGHSQAAGFTIPTGKLAEFVGRLCRIAETELAGKELTPCLEIDAETALSELGGTTFKLIQRLAPFGRGNPSPTFVTRRARVMECRTMGNKGEHLRLKLRQNAAVWDAVFFGQGEKLSPLPSYIDIVYNLEVDVWQGREQLRLNIQDFRAAEGSQQ